MIGGGIPCPICGTRLQLTLDFIVEHNAAACPKCYTIMQFPKNDVLFEEYKKIKSEMETLKKQIKRFG